MSKSVVILGAALTVLALPFVFRRAPPAGDWRPGDPVLTIVSPHNEAIREEFGAAFSRWHQARFGRPVRVDWRNIGGTTEIARYLSSAFVASARAWWLGRGRAWTTDAGDAMLDRRFNTRTPPEVAAAPDEAPAEHARRRTALESAWRNLADLHQAFRATDDPAAISAGIDLFFGGGEYDHSSAFGKGLTVPPWPGGIPSNLVRAADGRMLVPAALSGEIWRTDTLFGVCLSAFGICYNPDRLRDLGIAHPPATWRDLADPAYAGQLGVADPTKSGSIAKAFEMIIQEQIAHTVRAAGFADTEIAACEAAIAAGGRDTPATYQAAVADGWAEGLRLVQRIGANARYFTDAAGKVPVDVGMGDAAAGIVIDFYGRYHAEATRGPEGSPRLIYVTPTGGSSISADPVSLLRGAPHRDTAVRFIEFLLAEEGQCLWTYRPGTPGGPTRHALRRLPIRRDFYPADTPDAPATHERHRRHAAEDLADPAVNPYRLAECFTYRPRWTSRHFGVQRDIIRAMCLDAGEELRAAWRAIAAAGGPARVPEAMRLLGRLPDRPEPLAWGNATDLAKRFTREDLLREWTLFYRRSYDEARRAAEAGR